MAKLPGFMFYTGDWLKDPALRLCSLGSRGLWMDMLCLMHESPRRGFLQHPNGSPVTAEQIARMVGCSPGEASGWLTELDNAGVFSRTVDGVIFSRRMDRDERKRTLCAEAGRRGGGNPTFIGGPKGESKGPPKVDPKVPPNTPMKMKESPPPPLPSPDSGARARKVAALNAAESAATGFGGDPLVSEADAMLSALFRRLQGLSSAEVMHVGRFVGWVDERPAPTIHGQPVTQRELARKVLAECVAARIDGTVKGATEWCKAVYDRCERQGCWPSETPERKANLKVVKPPRDISRILEDQHGNG